MKLLLFIFFTLPLLSSEQLPLQGPLPLIRGDPIEFDALSAPQTAKEIEKELEERTFPLIQLLFTISLMITLPFILKEYLKYLQNRPKIIKMATKETLLRFIHELKNNPPCKR